MPGSHLSDTTQAWARGLGNFEPPYVPPIASNPPIPTSPGLMGSHRNGSYGGAKIDVLAQRLAVTAPMRISNPPSDVLITNSNASVVSSSQGTFQNKAKQDWLKSLLKNPIFPAIVAALVTIIILSLVGPSFVKNNPTNPIYRPSIEIWKIILWGLIIGAIVYIVPLLYYKMKKKK